MSKEMYYGEASRKKILNGIKKVYDTVRVTMWPKGKNVLLQQMNVPIVTNDGVTVAKHIQLKDNAENMWVKFIQEAASKTNSVAGDGTTLTTVLSYAMANEGMKYINNGVNPFLLTNELHSIKNTVFGLLDKLNTPVDSREKIKQIATISSQSEEIGEIIADTIGKVGNEWAITVEEGKVVGIYTEITKWYKYNQGYISPYFVSDKTKMESVIENAHVIITDKVISNINDILPAFTVLATNGIKDIVLIAEDVVGDALTAIIMNHMKRAINIAVVRAPSYGDNKKEMLRDIAAVTGGKIFSDELGLKIADASMDCFGKCDKYISDKQTSIIVWGQGTKEDIQERIASVKALIEIKDGDIDRFDLERRIAALSWGVAVIRVGAGTEMEMQNKRLKLEDALNATRVAIQDGLVAGGGSTFVKISNSFVGFDNDDSDEYSIARKIFINALLYPIKQICENAGVSGDVVVQTISESSSNTYGYNAKTSEFVDMIEAGIVDPVAVLKNALENAVSAASMLLTLDAIVVEEDEAPKYEVRGGGDF